MSLNPIDLIKASLASEPARLIAYATGAALTAANIIGHALGYTALPDGVANGLTLLVTAIVTEAIRRFVYAPATVEAAVTDATTTAVADAIDAGEVIPAGDPALGDDSFAGSGDDLP